MGRGRRSPFRFLAPIALIAFVFVLSSILMSAADSDENTDPAAQEEQAGSEGKKRDKPETERDRQKERENELPDDVYIVQTGDTLGEIAAKTGLTLEELQLLNPELDPQALVSGQRIRLKE